jgi:hypothetical protein
LSSISLLALLICLAPGGATAENLKADVVVAGGTPAGLAAALAAARSGHSVIVAERTGHLGGLPANGLGNTDIATRSTIGGIFQEFIAGIRKHYEQTYGPGSPQVRDSSDGYRFEASVAERVLNEMVHREARIRVLLRHQFDGKVERSATRLASITLADLERREPVTIEATIFIDATYEGDLAAAAGVPYRIGREGRDETLEPYAGVIYMYHGTKQIFPDPDTGKGDGRIQAYNFRLCLTQRPDLRIPPAQPPAYDRGEYVSLLGDIRAGRIKAFGSTPAALAGVFNIVPIPNGKSDTNHHHNGLISTDLAEENQPWPEADWAWRSGYETRLRNFTLGLLYFTQHDSEVPAQLRDEARSWGLCKDEYTDNGHFPRQLYVREARRIVGRYDFSAHDAITAPGAPRTRIASDSITAAHYPIDSHALRNRQPGKLALDGFLSLRHITSPYTVPYGVMAPREMENLLVPVAVSATHLGYGTLRMEPSWMAMGQAAGTAAALAISGRTPVQSVPVRTLQKKLLEAGQVLVHYRDLKADEPYFRAMQYFAVQGWFPYWDAEPQKPVLRGEAVRWLDAAGIQVWDRGQPLETLDWNVLEQWVGKPLTKGKFFYVLRHEFATVVYENPNFPLGGKRVEAKERLVRDE